MEKYFHHVFSALPSQLSSSHRFKDKEGMTSLFGRGMSCVSGASGRLLLQQEPWVLLVMPDNYE